MEENMPAEPEGAPDIRQLWSKVRSEVLGVAMSGVAVGVGAGLSLIGVPYAWVGAICGGIGVVRGNKNFSTYKKIFP